MPIKITRPVPSDVSDIVNVHWNAMQGDPVIGYMFGAVEPGLRHAGDVKYFEKKFTQARHMGFQLWKAVDEDTGKMAGIAIWEFPVQLSEQEKQEKAAMQEEMKAQALPEGANEQLIGQVIGQIGGFKERHCNPERDHYMSVLAVDPAYHRRGIGGMLLDAGLAEVDKAGGDTVIVASAMGLGLYLKHGFVPIDEVTFDLDAAGIGHGLAKMKCLRREGRGRKEVE